MSSRRSTQPAARWPFWLLLAAWVCANSPQVAVFAVCTWLYEARQFTHQQRLTTEVAYVLGGERAPGIFAEAMAQAPVKPPPIIPAEAMAKKIQLSVESVTDFLPPALRASRRAVAEIDCRDVGRAPPLLMPPRAYPVA